MEQYTSSLPVLSKALRAEWRAAGNEGILRRIRLASAPTIFGPKLIRSSELRVWRRTLSPDVRASVRHLVARMDREVDTALRAYFAGSIIELGPNGELQAAAGSKTEQPNPVDLATVLILSNKFESPNLTVAADIVAADLFAVLHKTLTALPPCTFLKFDNYAKGKYESKKKETGFTSLHFDRAPRLLIHYSDPGTPYCGEIKPFRTQVGDVSIHGTDIEHGFASAPERGWEARARLCAGFDVHYAR